MEACKRSHLLSFRGHNAKGGGRRDAQDPRCKVDMWMGNMQNLDTIARSRDTGFAFLCCLHTQKLGLRICVYKMYVNTWIRIVMSLLFSRTRYGSGAA
jgi:hypothetical protein